MLVFPRPSPPRQQRPAPLPPQADRGQDYIPEQVGRSLYDSLKIIGPEVPPKFTFFCVLVTELVTNLSPLETDPVLVRPRL
jgi:hypothetical protein